MEAPTPGVSDRSPLAAAVGRAGLTVVVLIAASKAVGFIREAVVAAVFGASRPVDLYLAAVAIPGLIGTVLHHSLPNAFVPLFSPSNTSRRDARRIAILLLGAAALTSAAMWALAPWVSVLTSAGFDSAGRSETIVLLRILSLTILFIAAESLLRSRLLARKEFAWPNVGFILQNTVMIAAIVAFPEGGARTLAVGYLAGTGAAMVWTALRARVPWRSSTPPGSDVKPLLSAGLAWVVFVVLVDSVSQLYVLIDRHFAAYLPAGAIASLQYGGLIAAVPLAVAGTALATAVFPYLSDALAEKDDLVAGEILNRGIRWSMSVAVPSAVLMFLLREPIVRVVYERGAFAADSRGDTALVLGFLAIGIIPSMLAVLCARFAYARAAWKPVLTATLVGLLAKLITVAALAESMGLAGIAAGSVVGYSFSAAVLLWGVPATVLQKHGRGWIRHIAVSLLAFGTSTLVASRLGYYINAETLSGSVIVLTVAGGGGLLLEFAIRRLKLLAQ